MVKLNEIPQYRTFVKDRDKALEKILQNSQLRMTSITQEAFGHSLQQTVTAYANAKPRRDAGHPVSSMMLDHSLMHNFTVLALNLTDEIHRMKRLVYTLTAVSEMEALGRGLGKNLHYNVKAKFDDEMKSGVSIRDRVNLACNRARRNLINAFETALANGLEPHDANIRFYNALPKRKFFIRTPQELTPIRSREAKNPEAAAISMATGFVSDQDWQELVEAYLDEEIPPIRGPETVIGIPVPRGARGEKNIYGWELEQDVVQSFVEEVRSGQVDAAKSAGIMDFVWVAVIDDRTEDFDRWADGKLTSEISEAIESGRAPDSEFQSEVPPAHFNCRCTLAPVTAEMPESPVSNAGDFESWLNT